MAEYIEREAVLKRLGLVDMDKSAAFHVGIQFGVEFAVDVVKESPAADVAPVVRGRWDDRFDGITPYCTACGRSHRGMQRTPPYCPNCGAKMEE